MMNNLNIFRGYSITYCNNYTKNTLNMRRQQHCSTTKGKTMLHNQGKTFGGILDFFSTLMDLQFILRRIRSCKVYAFSTQHHPKSNFLYFTLHYDITMFQLFIVINVVFVSYSHCTRLSLSLCYMYRNPLILFRSSSLELSNTKSAQILPFFPLSDKKYILLNTVRI